MTDAKCSADEALSKLKAGNQAYIAADRPTGDISSALRLKTCKEGQFPYAIVIACSDSRVIPEAIFQAGIGELFVIRVAGNVIDPHQLGSIEYATDHLGTRLIFVLGHDHCGAVGAAINSDPDGHVKSITDQIKAAIGDEKDEYKASELNAKNCMAKIRESFSIGENDPSGLKVSGGIYRIESGQVDFF